MNSPKTLMNDFTLDHKVSVYTRVSYVYIGTVLNFAISHCSDSDRDLMCTYAGAGKKAEISQFELRETISAVIHNYAVHVPPSIACQGEQKLSLYLTPSPDNWTSSH